MKTSKYGLNAIGAFLACFLLSAYMLPLTCHANAPKTQMPTSIAMSIEQFQQLKNNNDRLAAEFDMCKIELTTLKTQSAKLKQQLTDCRQQLTTTSQLLTKVQSQLIISNDDLKQLRVLSQATEQCLLQLKNQIDAERKLATRTQKRLRWQRALDAVLGSFAGYIIGKNT